ncbi:MAG: NfeD family protein, partial [Pseudomonadales bacterium]
GPGFVGVICLLLAFYAFQVLPVSYTGALLILLGVALLIAEALIPSFGILGLSGVAAFIIGSIVLMDTELPAYQIAKPLVFGFAAISAGLLVVVMRLIVRSRRHAVVTGLGALTGHTAVVEEVDGQQVWVRINGERWRADCVQALRPGDTVVVEGVSGLLLSVSKQERQS